MDEAQAQLQRIQEQLTGERKVRALAEAGSFGTPLAWAGSQPTLLVFERGLKARSSAAESGVRMLRVPYEWLETWPESGEWHAEPLFLGQLSRSRPVYDPAGGLARVRRALSSPTQEQLSGYRDGLLNEASKRLSAVQAILPLGSGVSAQVLALAEARSIALTCLYPALLSHLALWPTSGVRVPHFWRAQAGLRFPRGIDRFEQLYAFGGEREARRVLLATRGLNLVEPEKRARLALQAGYYDGAVRFLRDEAAQRWRAELENWTYLSGPRREKLSLLLGVGSSPLGPVAAEQIEQLIADVRVGR